MSLSDIVPFIIGILLTVIPTWRIVQRTGYPPALSLLVVVPLIGPLVVLIVLAYGDWPLKKTGMRGNSHV